MEVSPTAADRRRTPPNAADRRAADHRPPNAAERRRRKP